MSTNSETKLEFFKKWGYKKLTSDYGNRKNPFGLNGVEFHQGIDLVKEDKGDVPAFVAGDVLYAKEGIAGTGVGGYGNVVVIEDVNGALHIYGHLDSVLTKKGDKVKENQVIGTQGTTGRSTGSHLHYEIRKQNGASFGFNKDKEKMTHEPYEYLIKFFAQPKGEVEKKVVEKEQPKVIPSTYKIKAGDTLSSIAKEHKTTVKKIMELNPSIKNASKIKAGDVINVK